MDGIGSPSRPPVGVPPSEASESVVGSTAPLRQHGARLNSAKNDSGTDIADGLGGEVCCRPNSTGSAADLDLIEEPIKRPFWKELLFFVVR